LSWQAEAVAVNTALWLLAGITGVVAVAEGRHGRPARRRVGLAGRWAWAALAAAWLLAACAWTVHAVASRGAS
jgi:hypothetical protein